MSFVLGALLSGGLMIRHAVSLYQDYTAINARKLFLGSILYLPATLTLLMFDQKILPQILQM